MSISFWIDQQRYQKNSTRNFDIVVIGGGIAGLSAAYWLKKEDPSMSVAIVEKGSLGFGATGRNAGFITCGSVEHYNRMVEKHGAEEAQEIWRFSEENLRLLKEHVIKDKAEDIYFEHKGSFSLASTNEEFKELQKVADLMRTNDINVDVLEEQSIRDRLNVEGFVGGIKYVEDASVDPISMLNLLRERLEEFSEPVEFFEYNEVYEMTNEGDSQVVKTQKNIFNCSAVVLATNGYSPLLHNYFADKIYPTRGQILITEPVERFMEGPCYANFVLDYFRQLTTGEVIIGGFRQLQKDAEIGYSDQTSDVIQSALHEFLERHIPPVKGKKITHRWSGIMGFSADGQPLIGSLPENPQVYFTGGFTAHGLGLAFNTGKYLTSLIFGNEVPSWISARRF